LRGFAYAINTSTALPAIRIRRAATRVLHGRRNRYPDPLSLLVLCRDSSDVYDIPASPGKKATYKTNKRKRDPDNYKLQPS
jgi:hypothetical protein